MSCGESEQCRCLTCGMLGRVKATQIPPTQMVDCSGSTYRRAGERPTPSIQSPKIPPTQLVDYSGSTYSERVRGSFGNPPSPKSHQRSWWIVQAQPTHARANVLLTPSIQSPKSHQRSWWIIQAQPTRAGERPTPSIQSPQIPPTQLVDCSGSTYPRAGERPTPSNQSPQIPPTQLVDYSGSTYPRAGERPTPSIQSPQIPPTQLVDYSGSTYSERVRGSFGNPPSPKSHQRTWWMF
jgi:hypothetical protein